MVTATREASEVHGASRVGLRELFRTRFALRDLLKQDAQAHLLTRERNALIIDDRG